MMNRKYHEKLTTQLMDVKYGVCFRMEPVSVDLVTMVMIAVKNVWKVTMVTTVRKRVGVLWELPATL